MKRISELVGAGRILVSDGAWGTFLQQKGLAAGACPEEWCLTRRADVLDIPRSYVEAGADMVLTNSFGANALKLEHFGLAGRVAEINRAAAEISREAAGRRCIVLGSMGPTGKLLLMGDVTEEALYGAFRDQAVGLEAGGADAACIETMSALDEAVLAVKAVRENTKLEVVCTFTFDVTIQGDYRTMMGVSPEEMAKGCVEAGADVIGANCGIGFEHMIPVARRIRAAAPGAPILIHANAGKPVRRDGKDSFPDTPELMAGLTPELVAAGADVVGGCCGTTPAHIRAIAAKVRELEAARRKR